MRWIHLALATTLGCGGSHAVGLTERSPSGDAAKDACGASEPTSVLVAHYACCTAHPSLVAEPASPDPRCVAPSMGADKVAILACVPGDPSEVTGIPMMPDGAVAILTAESNACGGMVRANHAAWWVAIPAHAKAGMVSCRVTHEDCSGPPRP